MSIAINLRFFSPRWGHEDTYTFELTRDYLEISMLPRKTKCTWIDNQDPEWSGESLYRILSNDSIYPPEVFQDLIVHAWTEWRNGTLDNHQVRVELEALQDWLNQITRTKPNSKFWSGYF